MKFKHIVTHVEDLKYASFKISELEKSTREQEWKNKHMLSHKTYSALVCIVLSILTLYGLYKLGQFVAKHCKSSKTLQAIAATTTDHLGIFTESSGTGNTVNTNIKTSNESLAVNPEAIPLQNLDVASTHESTPELRR
jgi:capsule polysaccharide export protein KpsE/RkpR